MAKEAAPQGVGPAAPLLPSRTPRWRDGKHGVGGKHYSEEYYLEGAVKIGYIWEAGFAVPLLSE